MLMGYGCGSMSYMKRNNTLPSYKKTPDNYDHPS